MRVTILQVDLYWEDQEKNLAMFSEKLDGLKPQTDLIVLPGMFTTGFLMGPEKLAEEMTGATFQWLKRESEKYDAVVIGSYIVKEKGKYFNRLVSLFPDGSYFKYDKRHLFRMGEENKHYSAGTGKLIINHNEWRICPLICYDLRFPVWS